MTPTGVENMFTVKNIRTGKLVKDAVSGKLLTWATKEEADKYASSLNVFASVGWKRDRFVAVA
jgi:hypothetical protein